MQPIVIFPSAKPKAQRKKSLPPLEEAILADINFYHRLSLEQVRVLCGFGPGSYTKISGILHTLATPDEEEQEEKKKKQTYVTLIPPEFYGDFNMYMLGIRGVRYLRKLGKTVHFHRSSHKGKSKKFLYHTLSVNDVLIACSFLPSVNPEITIPRMYPELALKSMMAGEIVVADGLMDIRIRKAQICIWLEMDMGTEEEDFIRAKVRNILLFVETRYRDFFGTYSLTIAFVTPESITRRDNLKTWVENELVESAMKQWGKFFRLAFVPGGSLDPAWVFYEPIWIAPFTNATYSLLSSAGG